jgi:hypothetical protein
MGETSSPAATFWQYPICSAKTGVPLLADPDQKANARIPTQSPVAPDPNTIRLSRAL